jgi:sugar (pentulose or hexulose) kinase
MKSPSDPADTSFSLSTSVAGGTETDKAHTNSKEVFDKAGNSVTAGVPVAAGGGDNAGAAVGTGIVREGLLSSSVGTSGVLFAHTDAFSPDPSGRLHAFCHAVPGAYHLIGVTLSAGCSLA